MKPEIFENNAEGIKQVYRNNEWSVSIKNWKPITADEADGGFTNIELTPMEIGKVAHVGMGQWFYSITQRDSKIVYIQRSDCSMENSEIKYMTPEQVKAVQAEAAQLLAQ